MGKQDGGGLARRARQLAPIAALAGAAAAGAATAYRRRRRSGRISPERSMAGPPSQQVTTLVAQLTTALEPSPDASPVPAAEPTADRPPLVRRGAEVTGSPATETTGAVTTAVPLRTAEGHGGGGENGQARNGADAATAAAAAAAIESVPRVTPAHRRLPDPAADSTPAPPAPPSGEPDPDPALDTAPMAPAAPPAVADLAEVADLAPDPDASPVPDPALGPATRAATRTDLADSGDDRPRPRTPGFATRQLAAMRRHRARLIAGLVVVALGVGASAALAGVEDDPDATTATAPAPDDDSASDDDSVVPSAESSDDPASSPPSDGGAGEDTGGEPTGSSTRPSSGTGATTAGSTSRPIVVADVFAVASDRLTTAGSFRYQGESRATDVSTSRPMMWLAVETRIRGEVDLDAGRVHEVAEADGGRTSETIVDGTAVWGRRADTIAAALGLPYALVPELSRPDGGPAVRGFAQLPGWLAAAEGATEIERAPDGRRFQATVPGSVFGAVERGRPAEDIVAVVTVADDGTPVRIELATSATDHLRLAVELTAHGAPVAIVPPAPPGG